MPFEPDAPTFDAEVKVMHNETLGCEPLRDITILFQHIALRQEYLIIIESRFCFGFTITCNNTTAGTEPTLMSLHEAILLSISILSRKQ